MVNITALITLRGKLLAKILTMTYSYVIPSLIFDLFLLFSSGGVSMYSSSPSFLCSLPRFLVQPSLSLGESLDSRVFSLLPPM